MTQEHDDGLTDEEREALLDDDEGAEPKTGAEGEEGDTSGADDDGAGAEDDQGDSGSSDDAPGRDDGADDSDDEPAQAAPLLVANAPEGADETLKTIADQKIELRKKYDDGDLTFDEYESEKDGLVKQERDIERAIDRARIASDMEQQRRANVWNGQCADFLKANPEYSANTRLHHLLDKEVRELALTSDFKDRSDDRSGIDILAKAHANLVEAGIIRKDAPNAKPQDPPKPGQKPKLPPNLKDIPASDPPSAGDSKFASLDRLGSTDPIAYEEALMALSESARNEYLRTKD